MFEEKTPFEWIVYGALTPVRLGRKAISTVLPTSKTPCQKGNHNWRLHRRCIIEFSKWHGIEKTVENVGRIFKCTGCDSTYADVTDHSGYSSDMEVDYMVAKIDIGLFKEISPDGTIINKNGKIQTDEECASSRPE